MKKGIHYFTAVTVVLCILGTTANAGTKVDCGKSLVCTVVVKK